MKATATTIAIIAIVILFGWAIKSGMDKQDRADCYKWQEYATEYPGFYLTQNEADQCAYWKIEVNAPIGNGE